MVSFPISIPVPSYPSNAVKDSIWLFGLFEEIITRHESDLILAFSHVHPQVLTF